MCPYCIIIPMCVDGAMIVMICYNECVCVCLQRRPRPVRRRPCRVFSSWFTAASRRWPCGSCCVSTSSASSSQSCQRSEVTFTPKCAFVFPCAYERVAPHSDIHSCVSMRTVLFAPSSLLCVCTVTVPCAFPHASPSTNVYCV